jgi:hypothetical protein
MPDPCIFKLDSESQSHFAKNDEAFSGSQLGRVAKSSDRKKSASVLGRRRCIPTGMDRRRSLRSRARGG